MTCIFELRWSLVRCKTWPLIVFAGLSLYLYCRGVGVWSIYKTSKTSTRYNSKCYARQMFFPPSIHDKNSFNYISFRISSKKLFYPYGSTFRNKKHKHEFGDVFAYPGRPGSYLTPGSLALSKRKVVASLWPVHLPLYYWPSGESYSICILATR